MATFKQTLVQADVIGKDGTKGKRNDSNIRASFPASPIYVANGLTDAVVYYQGVKALNGNVPEEDITPVAYDILMTNPGEVTGTGGYYGGSDINLNYTGDPTDPFAGPTVVGKTADEDGNPFNSGGGTPTNPWVPALASPSEIGKTEPSDLPNYGGDLSATSKLTTGTKQYGAGSGHLLDPSTSSAAISTQTIGHYTKGSSS
jgi:hypothetical protein